jgi:predicted aldo/keto reductase-like oxidoreductase
MEYRRFGKTEKHISAITLGGMRFNHAWDQPRHEIPQNTQDHCNRIVDLAVRNGINHFETAHGYIKSETVFGRTLNDELKLERSSYYLMTKGNPTSADDTRKLIEEQLKTLKTDYIDFYGWHGINTPELVNIACKKGGPVEELLKMKEEGIIKHIGFSTHGHLETIEQAINTNLFEFVNLHYYYFYQRNLRAIRLAEKNDLGVFIISPNDKGGQLYKAPDKIKSAIPHATPIQWNARFCLDTPHVHTLSFGMTEPEHFEEMKGIFTHHTASVKELDAQAKAILDAMLKDDQYAYYEGYDIKNKNTNLDIPLLLHWRKLWKCYDLLDYSKYRYKELKTPNHWVPGVYANTENLNKFDFSQVPDNIPLKEMLSELHEALYQDTNPPTSFDAKKLTLFK